MRWIAAVSLVLGLAAAAHAEDVKIGYVDLQRALTESEAGEAAKTEFEQQMGQLQEDLSKQKDDLQALKDQLERKGPLMKAEQRRNLEKDYQRKLKDFERSYQDAQEDLRLKDNELTASILRDLQVVIQEYGQAEGFTMILEGSTAPVLYVRESLDITDTIVERYNKEK